MINAVYMATPEISVNCLQKLLNFNDLNIMAVVTQPDRPCGRGNKLTPPPVKEFALAHNIEVFQTESIKNDESLKEKLREMKPDFFITFAFGQILTQEILDIPCIATINLHASLLPKYRGANPIQRAIYNGDSETGITTMITVLELDAGDICMQEKIKITPDMTDAELIAKVMFHTGEHPKEFLDKHTTRSAYTGVCNGKPYVYTQNKDIMMLFKKEDGGNKFYSSSFFSPLLNLII